MKKLIICCHKQIWGSPKDPRISRHETRAQIFNGSAEAGDDMAQISDVVNDMVAQIVHSGVDACGDRGQMSDACRDKTEMGYSADAGGDKGQMSDACRDNAQITDAGNFNEATIAEAVAQIIITDGGDKNEILDFDFADAMQDFIVDKHYDGLEGCDDVGETLGENVGMSGSSAIVMNDDASNGIHEAGDKKRKRQDRVDGSASNKFRARGNDVLNTVCFEF